MRNLDEVVHFLHAQIDLLIVPGADQHGSEVGFHVFQQSLFARSEFQFSGIAQDQIADSFAAGEQGQDGNVLSFIGEGYQVVGLICFIDEWQVSRGQDGFRISVIAVEVVKASQFVRPYQQQKLPLFMIAWLDEADAVTVTHERLANDVMPVNQNVHVLPNAIPKEGQFLAQRQPKPRIRVGENPVELTRLFWAGGLTHQKDIGLLRYPVRSFKDLPIQMVMGGYSKTSVYHKMRNDFTNYGKLPHELLEALPVNDYYYMYSKCDIALIPLTESTFNSHKSNLKILEAANIGANVVVSNVHPYKDVPFVNYVDTPDDWRRHVKWILDNPAAAQEQALNLQQYCDERFNFTKINKTRKEILCSLTTDKHLKPSDPITLTGQSTNA